MTSIQVNYLPEGSLNVDDIIVIGAFLNNNIYILTWTGTGNDVVLVPALNITNPSAPTINPMTNPLKFRISGTPGNMVFQVTSPNAVVNQFLTFDTTQNNKLVLGPTSSSPGRITVSQSLLGGLVPPYQPWILPSLMLSAIDYDFRGVTTSSPNGFLLSVDVMNGVVTNQTIPLMGLPDRYFKDCTMGNNNSFDTLMGGGLQIAYCARYGVCSRTPAWTSQQDCIAGQVYFYCTDGHSCGQESNCVTFCPIIRSNGVEHESVCAFDTSVDNNFVCTAEVGNNFGNQVTPVVPTSIWSRPWFILVLLILTALIIAFIVAAIMSSSQPTVVEHHSSSTYHNHDGL